MSQATKFEFKPATERAKATFGKRHNRIFATADQDKESLQKYLAEMRALRPVK